MITETLSILSIAKKSIETFNSIKDLLPDNDEKANAIKSISDLQERLSTAEYAAAKELGYKLCTCTYPPQIMLYNKAKKSSICPNCNNSIKGSFAVFSD